MITIFLLWFISLVYRKQQRKQIRLSPAPVVVYDAPMLPDAGQAQRRAREEEKRDLARMELDHIESQRTQLMALCEALEAEKQTATASRRNTITRQIINLEDRLYKLDVRKAKAYRAAYAA